MAATTTTTNNTTTMTTANTATATNTTTECNLLPKPHQERRKALLEKHDYNAIRLIWDNEFEIRFEKGYAYHFSMTDTIQSKPYNPLKAIGLPQQSPDFNNGTVKRWDNLQGFKVIAIQFGENTIGIDCEFLTEQQIAQLERENLIKSQFDEYGQHKTLQALVMSNMHAPLSYWHESTTYYDPGIDKDYIEITMKFRGKNAFGARVLNTIWAKVDLYGNILEVKD